ncbi:anti-sigma factor family protein [Tepidibacillus sp. LV47]|uniref:anti-sigma factor family protein n=1 Tax=Tepidibacillus sp. LV47 TaxID=3398228 RepID=UPI003AAD264F
MSCSQYEHLIQGYVDQSITEEEKKELNEHIFVCENCRKELQDMIKVVSFVEDIGENYHLQVKKRMRKFKSSLLATCMTLCSAVVLVFYYPFESSIFNLERPRIQYRNIILADENEQLLLPDHYELMFNERRSNQRKLQSIVSNPFADDKDYIDITWVYPSVYSHLREVDFDQLSDEYVFINIPDEKTLLQLIHLLEKENLQVPIHVSHFPVSIAVYRGEKGAYFKEFDFPREVDQIHH